MGAGYFGPVISISRLVDSTDAARVVFDEDGLPLVVDLPDEIGPATLLVSDVNEALKWVDDRGRVTESVDRSTVWSVDAIVVDREVLSRLDEDDHTVDSLLEAVAALGYTWQISSTSAP